MTAEPMISNNPYDDDLSDWVWGLHNAGRSLQEIIQYIRQRVPEYTEADIEEALQDVETIKASSDGVRIYEKYMIAYDAVKKEAERRGCKIESKKSLEKDKLVRYFNTLKQKAVEASNGLDFLAEMISTLIADQALPNGNHRTSLFFVDGILEQNGFIMNILSHHGIVDAYFAESERIMERGYVEWRLNHVRATKAMLEKVFGAQSGSVASAAPSLWITRLIASSNDITSAMTVNTHPTIKNNPPNIIPRHVEGATEAEMLREAIAAELDAINLYEKMAAESQSPLIKEVMLDVAKEEKTHVGEFQALLLDIDPEQAKELEEGAEEVKKL